MAHFSLGDWEDIFKIFKAYVIIIIKSEVSTLPIVIFSFRGCVSEMFVTSYSVTYYIYIPGKQGFCFHYYYADYDECKYSDTFWFADRVRLFVHYTISLSSLWKLIWGHWTYGMPVRYISSSVWIKLSIFSLLSIIQYMGLCVFSLPISLVMIERICTSSYNHHQIGSMNYYPLFKVRSCKNGMRCMPLYILMVVLHMPIPQTTDELNTLQGMVVYLLKFLPQKSHEIKISRKCVKFERGMTKAKPLTISSVLLLKLIFNHITKPMNPIRWDGMFMPGA